MKGDSENGPGLSGSDVVTGVVETIRAGTAGAGADRVGERLLALDRREREMWLRNSRSARRAEVVDALLTRSFAARHRDAGECLGAAQAALQAAESLEAEARPVATYWRAQAWLSIAHAHTLVERSDAASAAIDNADGLLRDGGADLRSVGDLHRARASLAWIRDVNEQALAESQAAIRIYEEHGRRDEVEVMRVFEAATYSNLGLHLRSIDKGRDALRRLDSREQPLLVLVGAFNIGLALYRVGQYESSLQVMKTLRSLSESLHLARSSVKIRWTEVLCLSRQGRHADVVRLAGPLIDTARSVGYPSVVKGLEEDRRRSLAALRRAARGKAARPAGPAAVPTSS